ncbi:Zinc finger, RING/FYVE/PHD-type [Cynara cardunculus var. scolymus]|uniref:RING-type E3 ubiquitin transferase n=1 Tax=Cynara cardunculus var. scolymus TaxID=59895 RepID=A0A103XJ85_CYNCS|nr:Zinc finger, RING/FYVE/PHD-type [Cynara cardunculus var. scolymus]
MGSLKDPKTWIPHINPKNCSQKNCILYCTKWCNYVILPSPPPPLPADDLGGATLSPVVIVIFALISSSFLVIAYCIIISRYCLRNNESSVSLTFEDQENLDPEMGVDDHGEDRDQSSYVPWLVLGKGLDEALIKSITICQYKRGDGSISCTDCSVCLQEFQEDESIKLLPKCSHAFHVYCIDTWLKTHLNCPLCRAKVCFEDKASTVISPPPLPPPPPPPPPVITVDVGGTDHAILEIREDKRRKIRRSKSMGYLCRNRGSIYDIWLIDQADVMGRQELRYRSDVGSSEHVSKETRV